MMAYPYQYQYGGYGSAYPQGFPQGYQQAYQQGGYQAAGLQQGQTAQHMQNGFVYVQNIEEARNYPVAPGNSVTFKDENAPYMYTKTMGFSQLDRPMFERYRLVKEDMPESAQDASGTPAAGSSDSLAAAEMRDKIGAMEARLERLEKEIESMRDAPAPPEGKKSTGKGKEQQENEP